MLAVRPLFDLKAETAPVERGRQLSCVSCGLYRHATSPRMPPWGENRRRVMTVGEGPGEVEDERGRPWQGKTGRHLAAALRGLGLDLERDCVSLNAVNCRPMTEDGRNREPTDYEVACCRRRIVSPAIEEHAPRVILLLGGSAVSSVLGPLCAEALGAKIGKWRGFAIPVPGWGAWVCPTYHPSYVVREADNDRIEAETVWKADIRRALGVLDRPVPAPEDLRGMVEVLRGEDEVLGAIRAVQNARFVSFDYETTGLRPALHEVVCASFAVAPDRAYSFMMPAGGIVPKTWAEMLADPNVGKISHNMKFENEWSRAHFGIEEISWAWDSMLGAHILDNRSGICGLKHQGFLHFGIPSWDDQIAPYLESTNASDPAAPNRIREFIERYGEEECLVYCGQDSLVAYRLAMRQMEQINEKAPLDGGRAVSRAK